MWLLIDFAERLRALFTVLAIIVEIGVTAVLISTAMLFSAKRC